MALEDTVNYEDITPMELPISFMDDMVINLDEEDVEGEEEEEDKILVYDDDEPNLVAVFVRSQPGRESLKDIAKRVLEDRDDAFEKSEEYRDRRAEEWRIFSGELPPKTEPFEGCANSHVPICLENISRLQFRVLAELFGDWTNVFGVIPVGPDDQMDADMLSLHGNWQITEEIPDFSRQQGRGTLIFFLNGDVTAHSYYDINRRQNRHEILTSDEFFTPYVYTTTMPDYSDVPYLIKILQYNKNEMEARRGIWYGVDEVIDRVKPSWDDEPDMPLNEAEAEVQHIVRPDMLRAPYKLIHYEGWMDLPNQVRQRYVQVIMEPNTKGILHLSIHEEEDWRDRVRYDMEKTEWEQYHMAKSLYEDKKALSEVAENALLSDPNMEPDQMMAKESMLQMMPLEPEPVMPLWMEGDETAQPAPVRRVPLHLFAHGVCIEPLTNDKGLGFGRIESDFNRAANVALSQFTDAATLANCAIHLISDLLEIERPTSIKPGDFKKVSNSGPDLRNNIYKVEHQPANPQLMELVQMMYAWGQSSIQSPAVLSGEPGKSGETFRGIATRVEQATKQLSVATRNYSMFLTQILRNNAKINSYYLPEEEFMMVNNHRMKMMDRIRVGREMYRRDYRVTFRSDLQFTSEAARVQEADQLVQLSMFGPLQQNLSFAHAAISKALEARGHEDMIPKLGPKPPDPQTPFGLPPTGGPAAPGAPGQPPVPPGAAPQPTKQQ